MKKVVILLFIAMGLITMIMSSPAMSQTFNLNSYGNTGNEGMILWTSPKDGSVDISGDAWPTNQHDNVWLQYIPASIAALGLTVDNVLQQGTTPIANGTVQPPLTTSSNPAYFGTQPYIPLRTAGVTLHNLPVSAGDVIAVLVQDMYLYAGDIVGVNFQVQMTSDFQQQGQGTLSNPQLVNGLYYGLSGSLKPSSSHSTDAYEFYWAGGDLSGNATTVGITGGVTGTSPSGFQSGLELDLYSSGNLIGTQTVLGSSATYGSFDFGTQLAGNYVLQLTDLNATDDPPYNIEFSGSIGAPASPSAAPEPTTMLLLGLGLIGLAGVRRKIQN